MSVGYKYILAINSNGELYAWGNNWSGQLGDGTTTWKDEPTRIGEAVNWSSVSTGDSHTIAINSDGELYAWGHNQHGMLGIGLVLEPTKPIVREP